MSTYIVPKEDMNYLAQQSSGNLNMILSGMTALLHDNDTKVAMLENQTWFQRMCRTVSGKNKMTQQEIQRNHDKINAYMTQAMTELYEQQCIDRQVMMSLGNQLNELYAEHLQLKQMLGAFVSKLNEKIESIDNFHMLNTEIEQGIYSDSTQIVSICLILSQMDKRCIQDYRKMNILQRSMRAKNILNDDQISLTNYLMGIAEIPMEEAGSIYLELSSIRGNFMANLILNMMENYHFLPDMARKMKNKKLLVQSVIESEQLEPSMTLSISDVYDDLITSKLDMIEGLLPISAIQYDSKLVEAEKLFLDYKLDEAFAIFKTLAEKGNGRAMYFLGEYYAQPYGSIKQDHEEAKKWRLAGRDAGDIFASLNVAYSLPEDSSERTEIFNNLFSQILQLAESGNVFAQSELADLYEAGYGCPQNEDKQIHWCKKAAESGCWHSMNKLGVAYDLKNNSEEANIWFEKAAEIGFSLAQWNLGYNLDYGYGCEKNEKKANYWYEKAAEQGLPDAQYNLAVNLKNGYGCEKNYEKAFYWFKKAAEQELSIAQNSLALCYDNGNGVEKDSEKAFYWYKKAAENGSMNGQNNLAICYELGDGVAKDIAKAKVWYKKAAEQGHNSAATQLGIFAMDSFEYEEAVKWFRQAAEGGYADAQNRLGVRYENGEGVPYDEDEAFKWYSMAAKQGHDKAQRNLAACYYYGNGVDMDEDIAKDWLLKSAKQGNSDAKDNLWDWFSESI